MSKELIESLRYLANRPPYSGAADIMLRAADALEAKAAQVGDTAELKAALDRADAILTKHEQRSMPTVRVVQAAPVGETGAFAVTGTTAESATLHAAYQRAQQPQSAEAVAKYTNEDSWNCKYCRKTETCAALEDPRNFDTPQPSAGVVMPKYKENRTMIDTDESYQDGWNACLDEFARLNGKEVV